MIGMFVFVSSVFLMNSSFKRSVAFCAALCLSLHASSAVDANGVETPNEFHFTADLDGDGRLDIVILDRASGGFRVAYQQTPGVWNWFPARSTGMNAITGASVGRWFVTDRDGFAVVSPAANHAHIIHASVPGALPDVESVFGWGIGPSAVAAPDIGGAGNTVHSDLWLSSVENGAPSPVRLGALRHNGTTFSILAQSPSARTPAQVRTVPLKEGGIDFVVMLAVLEDEDDLFNAISFAEGAADLMISEVVPAGSEWTSGLLGPGPEHHVLTWRPGETGFLAHAVVENLPNEFSLASPVSHDLGTAIGQLHIVASDDGPRLVVIDESGTHADVHAFDGTNPPVWLQELQPAPGDVITGILPVASGGFHLLSRNAFIGITESATLHTPDGGLFVAGAPANLPPLRPAALRANVFAFGAEPFVDPAAVLLGRYSAPEWTSDPNLEGDQLTVVSEAFEGSAVGLGGKTPVSLGTVPMGTAFSLTNQYTGAISLHSLDTGGGAVGPSAEISPIPGIKSRAFYLELQPVPQNAEVYFRINDGSWTQWFGQSVLVYSNTSVSYFAWDPVALQPSALKSASYQFERLPHEIDSDDDGVPDFVEVALGLDPLGGVDSDGDGFSDLNEILAGTDPNDPDSRPLKEGDIEDWDPGMSERLEENIAFRMRVAPHPIDGTTGTRTTAADGVRLELYALDGSSLGGNAAVELDQPNVIGPGLKLESVVADNRPGFVAVMTEPVFPVATADADKDRGREIAGLFAIPAATLPEIDYTPGGGTLADEAAAWIAAAKLARDSVERPVVSGMWHEIDTLAALLLEWKLETIFLERGLPGLEPGKLTLFGGRRGDAGRFAPRASDYANLRERLSDALPGYLIDSLFEEIAEAAISDPAYEALRSAATAIYSASSASANAADPGTYLPPFDVLRAFVRGAPLPEPYLSESGIDPATLAAAQASAASLLAGLPPRPVETFTLVVEEDSFSGGCHRLTIEGTDQSVNLFSAPGLPYASTDGFSLLPGTVLEVTGHPDLDEGGCPGTDLEVLQVTVISFPIHDSIDANGNLLPDAWEWTFLLGEGNPFDDDDDDGYTNLQELLDGTDPLDPDSYGMEAVDLGPPTVEIVMNGFDDVDLLWTYPSHYAQFIEWIPESSEDLVSWTPLPAVAVEVEPGLFSMQFTVPDDNFFRIRMALK